MRRRDHRGWAASFPLPTKRPATPKPVDVTAADFARAADALNAAEVAVRRIAQALRAGDYEAAMAAIGAWNAAALRCGETFIAIGSAIGRLVEAAKAGTLS